MSQRFLVCRSVMQSELSYRHRLCVNGKEVLERSRDTAISEIAKMSLVSVDVEPSFLEEVGRASGVLLVGGTMLRETTAFCIPALEKIRPDKNVIQGLFWLKRLKINPIQVLHNPNLAAEHVEGIKPKIKALYSYDVGYEDFLVRCLTICIYAFYFAGHLLNLAQNVLYVSLVLGDNPNNPTSENYDDNTFDNLLNSTTVDPLDLPPQPPKKHRRKKQFPEMISTVAVRIIRHKSTNEQAFEMIRPEYKDLVDSAYCYRGGAHAGGRVRTKKMTTEECVAGAEHEVEQQVIACTIFLYSGLWFAPPESKESRTGIQVPPVLPITEVLFSEVMFARQLVKWIVPVFKRKGGVGEGWKGFVYALEGIYDNKAALKKIKSLSEHDDGNSLSNLLWWIFSKGDCKHYYYNLISSATPIKETAERNVTESVEREVGSTSDGEWRKRWLGGGVRWCDGDGRAQPYQLRKQQKEMLPKVWRGKWGPLVTESGESDGWEEGYGGVMVMEEVE
ncbi:probable endo-1,3(4)-beta-glucanase [Tanacetum coccineum]